MKHKKQFYALILIAVLALSLRILFLAKVPPRLTVDEMSIGYNAYSILKTGKDEWGETLPLSFRAFGDYKLPFYIYTSTPFIKLLGLNPWSTKIPSVLAGVTIVIAGYFLATLTTKNKTIGIITALLLAVNPWPIHLSRMALESNLALALFSIGLVLLLKSHQTKKNNSYAIFAGVLFGLTFYTYIAFRLILILLWPFIAIISRNKRTLHRKLTISFIAFILIILPIFSQLFTHSGMARLSQISLFTDPGINSQITEKRNFCHLTNSSILSPICRVIFTKPQSLSISFVKNYSESILPTFLFIDSHQKPHLSLGNSGEYYLFLFPFYLFGIFLFLKQSNWESNILKIAFFLSPIPSALTLEPQIVRNSALIPFISLFIAIGIWQVTKELKNKSSKKVFFILLSLIGLIFFINFLINYFVIHPKKFDDAAYRLSSQVATFLKEKQSHYDSIYTSKVFSDTHILLAFYNQIDPAWYQENVVRPQPDDFGFSHPTKLGNYYFTDKKLVEFVCASSPENILYLTDHSEKLESDWQFYNFSGVHLQAQVYDIDATRNRLIATQTLNTFCQNYLNIKSHTK